MISISYLYAGNKEFSHNLRYGEELESSEIKTKKPVVVWNITRACNLSCLHCYSESNIKRDNEELNFNQGINLLKDLAEFKVPVILFSGGEPLLREDIFELIHFAYQLGLRVVVSTNGTLITRDIARKLKENGVIYVGISIDGIRETNDYFRRYKGAYDSALKGIEYCLEEDIKVGLRFTMIKRNIVDIPKCFNLVEEMGIPRICFYHLVYSGRGSQLMKEALSKEETRQVVNLIIDNCNEIHEKGHKTEVLTVDNHADGIYLYLRMKKEKKERAEEVFNLLKLNGGNGSGVRIGCISWNGDVYPDQFWRNYSFGNVKEKKFSEVWENPLNDFIKKLRERKKHLKGRCAKCRWIDLCNGNLRARAEANGDVWGEDPACYLTDDEIGL